MYLGTLRSREPPAPFHYRKFPDPRLSHAALSCVVSKDKGEDPGCSSESQAPQAAVQALKF